ncbi:anticodon-binding aminoacyl-tRNA synthetase, class 1a [Tanacetum coccineum]|uniref:Anticodon-binding aminoacyl-tRNA synthetase, class 1a n=1 Tax=Tanacetum coccineum TaxID=301880 RepID=A0ABQ5GQW4_9ASTR
MHCLSTKSGSWDQFGSSLATALICLTEGRKFNWSSYIFKGMVNNITNPKKFLMFPRFLQMILNIETRNSKQYHAFKLTSKMFANMRLNFHGDTMPLLATMLPPAQPAIAGKSSGEAESTIPHTVLETLTEPAHSHDQASSPRRPTTILASAQENEQGPFSDPNPASSSRPHASEPKQFTSTNVEDDVFGGSFDISPPRSTEAPPAGTTSGSAEDADKLIALCSLVNSLVQKIDSQASDLRAHKLVFKEVVGKLVKKVKKLEDKLKGRKRKFVMTESDIEEEEEQDVDPLIKLAKAAATAADDSAVPTGDSNEDDLPPSSSFPSDAFAGGSDVPAGATTGPSTVYPSNTTVPTTHSVPAAAPIPTGSCTTLESPSSPERDARKGKCIAFDQPSQTQHKTFKQLEEERLGWEAAERLQAQELVDFEKQRVLASAANYSDAAWDIILARLQEDPDLSSIIFGVIFNDDDFAARMVELVNTRRKELAEQRAQERRDRRMTPSQLRQYMRTYVKNQGPAVYSTGWTIAQVRKLTPEQLQEEFDKIQRAVAFTRGFKRDGSPKTRASSKKLKTGGDDVNLVATSPSVPREEAGATHSPNVSQEEVAATSHSQDIPDAPATAPSTTTSTAHQTASSTKKVGTRRKRFGQKGVHPSRSTIPIEDGDPEAEHKMCIKYASDADSASDDDTPVNLHGVVDWELLPTGLGWVNVIYRKDNSRKCFSRLREILHLVTRTDLMIIYGRVMTFYQDRKATGVGLVLWGDLKVLLDSPEVNDGSDVWKNQNTWIIQSWKLYSSTGIHVLETVSGLVLHMFVDKKYPLSVNLIERMLDHQLEISRDTVGNELTTAVQLIAFLKKQISESRRPKIVVNVGFCLLENLDFWYTLLGKDHLVFKTVDEHFAFQAHLCISLIYIDTLVLWHHLYREIFWVQHSMVLNYQAIRLELIEVTQNWMVFTCHVLGMKKWLVQEGTALGKDLIKSVDGFPAGSVVPTGKDNSIVSTGSTKVIPAGRTILFLNLIYVCQFVRDNNFTIEFDAFGISVKDFLTCRMLLRCDSTGDIYPVTAPSHIPHAFLVSQHTWHQRLGHPGGKVLRRLVSSNFISCNKEKPPVLCHAC